MSRHAPLAAVREVLAGRPAWLVGGAVRDELLGRATDDVDIALEGDAGDAARALARATGGAAFRLSGEYGAWRVVGPDRGWHVDVVTLRDEGIDADLAKRDFSINAMAQPLAGGELLDPFGGRADLRLGRLRMVAPQALAEDPLRTLRAVRQAVELDLEIDRATGGEVARRAPELDRVAPERIFGELKRIVGAQDVRRGLELMEAYGITAAVLPEILPLHGVGQSDFHHADVHDHTLEVLDAVLVLGDDPAYAGLPEQADAIRGLLAEPLADELDRGGALRWAALLHDVAKPETRTEGGGRVGFPGHDERGADVAAAALRRLRASERLVEHVAGLVRHHLRLGFLVHERPLGPRTIWRYLRITAPRSADVTLLTVADRLATRGRNADAAIEAHLDVARAMLDAAFAERAAAPAAPLIRGDELARELGLEPGPELGILLAQLAEDRYAGAVRTRDEALQRARALRSEG